jgi:hypothetical protein
MIYTKPLLRNVINLAAGNCNYGNNPWGGCAQGANGG